MPPLGHQALWRADATDSETAQHFLETLASLARGQAMPTLHVLGPAPAPLGRKGNRHRWQLLMQARQRAPLHALLQQLTAAVPDLPLGRKVRWSLDVDPIDLY
jgi:primosomal protein N' (replication factor Y)